MSPVLFLDIQKNYNDTSMASSAVVKQQIEVVVFWSAELSCDKNNCRINKKYVTIVDVPLYSYKSVSNRHHRRETLHAQT